MKFECAPVCKSCEEMDVDFRCKVALYPGDLDRFYENMTTIQPLSSTVVKCFLGHRTRLATHAIQLTISWGREW
jgi:hypothetical protein